jgi:hypothetical protein
MNRIQSYCTMKGHSVSKEAVYYDNVIRFVETNEALFE